MKKVLVMSVSGIGNTILQSPLINTILKRDFIVDILFKNKTVETVFRDDNRINKKYLIPKTKKEQLKLILELRKNNYDYSIACFPSNRLEFNLFPFLIGVKKRVIHSYNIGNIKTLAFLSNYKIETDEKIHDVEQNLNLLKALDMDPEKEDKELLFSLSKEDKSFVERWIKENKIKEKSIIGIHPGCKRNYEYRRWPKEHFVKLINILSDQKKKIFLFAGPDEIEETNWIYNNSNEKDKIFLIENKSIGQVAALINKCKLFISTDSGLGHIANALKIHSFAIFGPAISSRTRPYGEYGHYISLNLPCSPCLKYPLYSTDDKIKCKDQKCLSLIKPEDVYEKIEPFL